MKPSVKILKNLVMLRQALQGYHPLVIEGHGQRIDKRCAKTIANSIADHLQKRWKNQNMTKPIILISQGDPLEKSGISAITRNVAKELELKRCLICLMNI